MCAVALPWQIHCLFAVHACAVSKLHDLSGYMLLGLLKAAGSLVNLIEELRGVLCTEWNGVNNASSHLSPDTSRDFPIVSRPNSWQMGAIRRSGSFCDIMMEGCGMIHGMSRCTLAKPQVLLLLPWIIL